MEAFRFEDWLNVFLGVFPIPLGVPISKRGSEIQGEVKMPRSSARDKSGGALDKAKGRLKEAAGAVSGNEGRKARGQGDQVKGEARKKKGHVKDLFK
jgi:uncharacterized protein YjbJ (UPF0337 family)